MTSLTCAFLLYRNKQWANAAKQNELIAKGFQESKKKVLSTISHEIRTPMSAILGIQEKILRNTQLEQAEKEILEGAHASAEGMLDVLNQMLDLSKIGAGKFFLKEEACHLQNLVKHICKTVSALAEKNQTTLICYTCPDIAESLLLDSTRLSQVLHNLINNAIKFSSGGKVSVTVRVLANDFFAQLIHFEIADNGRGFPQNQLQRLLEPFEQLDCLMIENERLSSGLGLTISEQLVRLMGGHLEIESAENLGTTAQFMLSLKRSIRDPKYQESFTKTEPKSQWVEENKTVLIVDDHIPSCMITESQFKEMRFCVHVSHSAHDAFNLMKDVNFDLLITDLCMPEMNGQELAIAAKKISKKEINIYGITADVDGPKILLNPDTPFDSILIKPASLKDWRRELNLERNYLNTFKNIDSGQNDMMLTIAKEVLNYQEKAFSELMDVLHTQKSFLSEKAYKTMAHKLSGGAKISNDSNLATLCDQFEKNPPHYMRPLFANLCIALIRSNRILRKIIHPN